MTEMSDHTVLFYDQDNLLIKSLTTFITEGINNDEACIVIASKAHRESLIELLIKGGLEIESILENKQLLLLDAFEALESFMIAGKPDQKSFDNKIGQLFLETSTLRPRVRAFGEMVNILWSESNQTAALSLEEMWNQLSLKIPFLLFCAYSTDFNLNKFVEGDFEKILANHTNGLFNGSIKQDIISGKVIDYGRDGLIVQLPDDSRVGITLDQLVS